MEVTGSSSQLEVIPAEEWQGAPFLADSWRLSTSKAEQLFGYSSLFSHDLARESLKAAIGRCLKKC
jgi:hypothetical protein